MQALDTPMALEGAVISERGFTFALATVAPSLIHDEVAAERLVHILEEQCFPGLPIALIAREWNGLLSFYGFMDASKVMAGVPLSRIPWRRYLLS
jgi:hypothetical protein